MSFRKDIPKMTVGKYAGVQIDKLPNSYLRWMLGQDFPKLWLDIAKEKLAESPYSNDPIMVSRHAIDQFSLRFIEKWINAHGSTGEVGLGTFIAKEAERAWSEGINVSKHRHKDDGIAKMLDGIVWIFGQNPNYPEYRDVITCFPQKEEGYPQT